MSEIITESKFSLEEFIQSGTIASLQKDLFLVGWGEREEFEDQGEVSKSTPSFYFPDFFLKSVKPWFVHKKWQTMSIQELLDCLPKNQVACHSLRWNAPDYSQFFSTYAHLQDLLNQKNLLKAVPYSFVMCPEMMTPLRLCQSLSSVLRYTFSQPLYVYGFWGKEEGMLGASPEMLFRCTKEKILETVACAGTYGRTKQQKKLLTDVKELHEHNLVVEGITNCLTPFGDVQKGSTSILKLPSLSHLITPIHVNLHSSFEFESIVRAMHPTPALGAFPRGLGNLWLDSYQKIVDRKRFGAPAGYYNPQDKNASCFVAIRNVQWDKRGLAIGAGCGIVKGSCLENEWQEINLKIQTIKDMLGL